MIYTKDQVRSNVAAAMLANAAEGLEDASALAVQLVADAMHLTVDAVQAICDEPAEVEV